MLYWFIALLVGVFGGHWVVKAMLRYFQPQNLPTGFPRAGMVIGFLERALIFSFLVLNLPTLIGFILTVKAIYRFGDIQGTNADKFKISEYFIIGTLSSFLFTVLIYGSAHLIIPMLS